MNLNTDFGSRVLVHSADLSWHRSPMVGVERRMLDRIGGEVARATTIVRYAPGSAFSAHTHTGGEEFIVLEGTFQDEHGNYPTGTYVRNPPTTHHAPGAADGCVIFVKLWQFDPDDRNQFRINMLEGLDVISPGVTGKLLHKDPRETVMFTRLEPDAKVSISVAGGGEILMIDGTAIESGDTLQRGSWLRVPGGDDVTLCAGPQGAAFWSKTGHLMHARPPDV